MATVWRALDVQTGRVVALKRVGLTSEHARERFRREARLLAELDHPGIVRHVAHGTTGEREAWMAMEWLEGIDLWQRLARGPLTIDETLLVMTRVAEAIGFAHARGVIHRDLKPGNLFLPHGDLSRPKVLDFGIARREAGLTAPGVVVGTLGYLAPEQARGLEGVDARADVFSLACVIYECVAGRPAFPGESALAVLAKVLLDDPPRLRDASLHAPPLLDALVSRMLAKDPEERPPHAGAVASVLAEIAARPNEGASRSSGRMKAIGTSELRLLSVVLVGPPPRPEIAPELREKAETIEIADPVAASVRAGADLGRDLGVAVHTLVDGSHLLSIAGMASAVDQAVEAVRIAERLAERATDVPIAVATGRGTLGERSPVGEAIDRAAALLRGAEPGVHVDALTRSLAAQRAASDQPLELVGREHELARILGVIDAALEEKRPAAVAVLGEPGLGKSRLAREVLERLSEGTPPPVVWMVRAEHAGRVSPYATIARLLRRVRTAKVGDAVDAVLNALSPIAAGTSTEQPATDPLAQRDAVRAAFAAVVIAAIEEAPLVLVVDDAHWADAPSLDLIGTTLKNLEGRPFAVLALGRSDTVADLGRIGGGGEVLRVSLAPLSRSAAERLARQLLGPSVPAARVRAVAERSAGNPLYLEELARTDGLGDERAAGLPDTVLAMMQLRLERASPDGRRLLRAASIVGTVWTLDAARALLGGDEEPAHWEEAIEQLRTGEMVTPVERADGTRAWRFRHGLVREAAYGMLVDAERREGHRVLAEHLEANGETDPAVLFDHYERGGVWGRAAEHAYRAALQAERAFDHRGTVRIVDRALRSIPSTWDEPKAVGRLLALRATGRRFAAGADVEGAAADAAQAMELLDSEDPDYHGALATAAVLAGVRGNVEGVLALIAPWGTHPEAAEARVQWVLAGIRLATQLELMGRLGEHREVVARIEPYEDEVVAASPAYAPQVHAGRAFRALARGDLVGYAQSSRAAGDGFSSLGNRVSAASMRMNEAYAWIQLGQHEKAVEQLAAVVETADRFGAAELASSARSNLGLALGELGRTAEARRRLEEAIALGDRRALKRVTGYARAYLAELLVAAGEVDAAKASADVARVALAENAPARAYADAVAAVVALARGQVAEALRAAAAARTTLLQRGHLPAGEPLVRRIYAEVLLASGDREAARTAIREESKLLAERATRLGDPALRKTFLDRVHHHARIRQLAIELDALQA